MIKVVYCITRKKGMTSEEFRNYWRNVHAQIGAAIPGIRKFVQSHTIQIEGDKYFPDFDGMVELWFDNEQAFLTARNSTEWQRSSADEENFIDDKRVAYFVTEEHEII
jgi:uncharacterized protein (TIGR02118 family)